ncbi:MAG: TRAP transporter substrate-binding protein [Deltaproteobacteria bacterium]|nr:TRAP transporter substrate-binding protein [Deltaproteobacteria bacterium]MBM4346988.1 TRAP transporter substrate-binding protein [Deltaproteobacteria bacterium]
MSLKKRNVFGILFVLFLACISFSFFPSRVNAQKIELSLGHTAPTTFYYHTLAMRFKEMLEKKFGDRVTVKVHPAGQLGSEKDHLEGLKIGSVDMAITMTSLLALWEPQMTYIDIPYLYRDIDHATKVLNGPIGMSINKKLENHGIMVLSCYNLGFRSVYSRKRPIFKPADLAGMKHRVIQNPLHIDLFNSWGAKAVPFNWGEVYTALQQGVLDSVDNNPPSYDIMKHYEVAPYFSITNHIYTASVLSMSKKKFDSLPKDLQQEIVDISKALVPEAIQITKDIDNKIVGKLVNENKVQFNTADIEAFAKASKEVSDKYSQNVGMDVIGKIRAVK